LGAMSEANIAYRLPLRRFSINVDVSSASLRRTFYQYSQNLLWGLIQASLLPPGRDGASWTGAPLNGGTFRFMRSMAHQHRDSAPSRPPRAVDVSAAADCLQRNDH
jgi:hypothetical protein